MPEHDGTTPTTAPTVAPTVAPTLAPAVAPDQVAALRHFNRVHTRAVGALEESFLGLDLPLTAARVLHDVGACDRAGTTATVRDLRRSLGLDSGHLSRLLQDLAGRGLVQLGPDPADRRRRLVRLTPQGRREVDRIEVRSTARATSVLQALSPGQRTRLTTALAEAEVLLRLAGLAWTEVEPDGDAARAVFARYVAELDTLFPDGFDPGPVTPPSTVVLVLDGTEPAAGGGLQWLPAGPGETAPEAEIKRMWVAPAWRGHGLGARLLADLERRAAAAGARVVRLDTHPALHDAIALYRRAGYRETARYNDNPHAGLFFSKRLTGGPGTGPQPGS